MPAPAQDDVKAILADFEHRIRGVVDGAWREWIEIPFRGKLVFMERARAILVFDYIARRAMAEFLTDTNIRVIKKKQTVQFLFKDQVLARFKKGNAKGVGSNIVTQAVLDFIDPERTIPGLIPDILKIEICYQPDSIGLDLDEVAIVARDRDARIWAYGLNPGNPGAAIIPIPPRAPDPSGPIVVPRQPKPEEKSSEEE